jgi:Putative restriction endonuclease
VSPDTYVEPDFCVFPHDFDLKKLDGCIVRLAFEVADSSFAYDTGRKISVYTAYRVREAWVVNAKTLVTRIHRQLGGKGYGFVRDLGPDELLMSALVPGLAVRFGDFGLRQIKTEG